MQALRQCHRQLKRPFTVLCRHAVYSSSKWSPKWPQANYHHHYQELSDLGFRGYVSGFWTSTGSSSRGLATSRTTSQAKRGNKVETPEVEFSEESISDLDSDFDSELEIEGEEELFDFSDSPRIDTGGTTWGAKGLEIAQRVLKELKVDGLELYAFRAIARAGLLDIRLDQLEDEYGSPTLDEVETFAREFYTALEADLGEEEAGRISVEVSSPGADREVKLPQELSRFKDLPMSVTYLWVENGSEKKDTKVLQILEEECSEEVSVWQLANVKLNRPQGRQNLTKKQAAQRFSIPYANIARTNLFIEI